MTINLDDLVSAFEERVSHFVKQYELEKYGIGARIYRWMEDTWGQWWNSTDEHIDS